MLAYIDYVHTYIRACMHAYIYTCIHKYTHTYTVLTYIHTYSFPFLLTNIVLRTHIRSIYTVCFLMCKYKDSDCECETCIYIRMSVKT